MSSKTAGSDQNSPDGHSGRPEDVSNNFARNNGADGLVLAFDVLDGEVEGNTANANGNNGINFSIGGSGLSRAETSGNTANNNAAEGMHLLFSGTGTSLVEVLNNSLFGSNRGLDRGSNVGTVEDDDDVVFGVFP